MSGRDFLIRETRHLCDCVRTEAIERWWNLQISTSLGWYVWILKVKLLICLLTSDTGHWGHWGQTSQHAGWSSIMRWPSENTTLLHCGESYCIVESLNALWRVWLHCGESHCSVEPEYEMRFDETREAVQKISEDKMWEIAWILTGTFGLWERLILGLSDNLVTREPGRAWF